MQPATLYARVSSYSQKLGLSIERQIELGLAAGVEHGVETSPDRYILDEALSAYHGVNRAEGGGLFEFERKALAGYFSNGHHFICENLDRISREGWEETYAFLCNCTKNGVTVVTYHDGDIYRAGDKPDMGRVIKLIVNAERAREESATKAKRITDNWSRKQRKAREGSKLAISKMCPTWLSVNAEREYIVIKERLKVLRTIYKWGLQIGSPSIANRLNQKGVPVWNGGKGWHQSFITALLTNRAVLGEYQPTQRLMKPFRIVQNGAPVLDLFPRVIDTNLFNRVQEARAGRVGKGGKRGTTQANIFQGFVKCAHCGGRMTYVSSRVKGRVVRGMNGNGAPITYIAATNYSHLRCDHALRSVRGSDGALLCTNRAAVHYQTLEPAVLDNLLHLAISDMDFSSEDRCTVLVNEIAEAQRYLKAKQERLATAADSFTRTGSSTMETMMLTLEKEVAADAEKIKAREARLVLERGRVSPEEHLERVRNIRDAMHTDDTAVRLQARMTVHQSLSRIIQAITCDVNKNSAINLVEGLGVILINARGEATSRFNLRKLGRDYLTQARNRGAVVGYLERLDERGF